MGGLLFKDSEGDQVRKIQLEYEHNTSRARKNRSVKYKSVVKLVDMKYQEAKNAGIEA